jgi:hypothetical protein
MRLIEDYLFSIQMAEATGHALGEKLIELLKPVIKDLTFYLGWEEDGIDVICFFAESHSWDWINKESLETVIVEVFPELKHHLKTPSGVYLGKREIWRVKRILEKWKAKILEEWKAQEEEAVKKEIGG